MGFLLLRPDELQGLVGMKEAIDLVAQAYGEAHEFPVINAPRRRVHSPAGVRISNFPGGVHGLGVIGSGTRPDKVNPGGDTQTKSFRGYPIHLVHDANDGQLLAILIGEVDEKTLGHTSVMALRTAATSGVGFRYLPRKDARTAGLFGSAGQAANQLLALTCERPIECVKIYSRSAGNRRRFAEKYGSMFSIEIIPVDSPREAVRGVDVVLGASNTSVPLFDGDWLEPGQHVTGIIGSNVHLVRAGFRDSRRREIDDATASRADVIVANLRDSVVTEEQGDLFEPIERGLIALDDIHELGELVTGAFPGRESEDQITYHKNNNGTGAADLAISMRAYKRARELGRGVELDLIKPETLRERFAV